MMGRIYVRTTITRAKLLCFGVSENWEQTCMCCTSIKNFSLHNILSPRMCIWCRLGIRHKCLGVVVGGGGATRRLSASKNMLRTIQHAVHMFVSIFNVNEFIYVHFSTKCLKLMTWAKMSIKRRDSLWPCNGTSKVYIMTTYAMIACNFLVYYCVLIVS